MKAIVLVAGVGRRLAPLTDRTHKARVGVPVQLRGAAVERAIPSRPSALLIPANSRHKSGARMCYTHCDYRPR